MSQLGTLERKLNVWTSPLLHNRLPNTPGSFAGVVQDFRNGDGFRMPAAGEEPVKAGTSLSGSCIAPAHDRSWVESRHRLLSTSVVRLRDDSAQIRPLDRPFWLAVKLQIAISNALEDRVTAIFRRCRCCPANLNRRQSGPAAGAPVSHGASEAIFAIFLGVYAVNEVRSVGAVLDIGSRLIDGDDSRLAVVIELPSRIQQGHRRRRSTCGRVVGFRR